MRRTVTDVAHAILGSPRGLAARLDVAPRHGLLPRVAAFLLAALVLLVTYTGWLYPLRPDAIGAVGHPVTADPMFSTAWGGPTLLGAWAVHALVALGIQVIGMAVLRRLGGRAPVDAISWSA
jgi:hypothetical protein